MSSLGRQRYLEDLSTSLFHFILPLLPTPEELNTKQQVRVLIEKLIRTVEPQCRLLSFGSTANGFSLRNSDMDLCVLLEGNEQGEPRTRAAELVTLIGSLLERETNFAVKALPKAYVPIIKLSLSPSPGLPFGIACDIGFENRLALENTRLLLTYATVDPARVRTMVLFLKVWSKRRKINSPYRGTLSSYGFTLLVLFFLIHIQSPPVLPNLQRIPPPSPPPSEGSDGGRSGKGAYELNGNDIWFFDDTEALRKEWSSGNLQSVGELLIDFFRFYCNTFAFNTDVVSIRAGLLTKESKQWTTDSEVGGINEMARDRNRLCIEDPFEISYNVARTVTKDGLYTIRGEFMRASRILTSRPERAASALASLCEERDDDLQRAPRSRSPAPRNSMNRANFGSNQRPVDRLSPSRPTQYLQEHLIPSSIPILNGTGGRASSAQALPYANPYPNTYVNSNPPYSNSSHSVPPRRTQAQTYGQPAGYNSSPLHSPAVSPRRNESIPQYQQGSLGLEFSNGGSGGSYPPGSGIGGGGGGGGGMDYPVRGRDSMSRQLQYGGGGDDYVLGNGGGGADFGGRGRQDGHASSRGRPHGRIEGLKVEEGGRFSQLASSLSEGSGNSSRRSMSNPPPSSPQIDFGHLSPHHHHSSSSRDDFHHNLGSVSPTFQVDYSAAPSAHPSMPLVTSLPPSHPIATATSTIPGTSNHAHNSLLHNNSTNSTVFNNNHAFSSTNLNGLNSLNHLQSSSSFVNLPIGSRSHSAAPSRPPSHRPTPTSSPPAPPHSNLSPPLLNASTSSSTTTSAPNNNASSSAANTQLASFISAYPPTPAYLSPSLLLSPTNHPSEILAPHRPNSNAGAVGFPAPSARFGGGMGGVSSAPGSRVGSRPGSPPGSRRPLGGGGAAAGGGGGGGGLGFSSGKPAVGEGLGGGGIGSSGLAFGAGRGGGGGMGGMGGMGMGGGGGAAVDMDELGRQMRKLEMARNGINREI